MQVGIFIKKYRVISWNLIFNSYVYRNLTEAPKSNGQTILCITYFRWGLKWEKMKNKNDCRQKENWVPWPCPLKAKYGDMGSNFMEIGAVAVNFNGKESPPFVISSRKVYLSFFFVFFKN